MSIILTLANEILLTIYIKENVIKRQTQKKSQFKISNNNKRKSKKINNRVIMKS